MVRKGPCKGYGDLDRLRVYLGAGVEIFVAESTKTRKMEHCRVDGHGRDQSRGLSRQYIQVHLPAVMPKASRLNPIDGQGALLHSCLEDILTTGVDSASVQVEAESYRTK